MRKTEKEEGMLRYIVECEESFRGSKKGSITGKKGLKETCCQKGSANETSQGIIVDE
jgi:hypothetical protein